MKRSNGTLVIWRPSGYERNSFTLFLFMPLLGSKKWYTQDNKKREKVFISRVYGWIKRGPKRREENPFNMMILIEHSCSLSLPGLDSCSCTSIASSFHRHFIMASSSFLVSFTLLSLSLSLHSIRSLHPHNILWNMVMMMMMILWFSLNNSALTIRNPSLSSPCHSFQAWKRREKTSSSWSSSSSSSSSITRK